MVRAMLSPPDTLRRKVWRCIDVRALLAAVVDTNYSSSCPDAEKDLSAEGVLQTMLWFEEVTFRCGCVCCVCACVRMCVCVCLRAHMLMHMCLRVCLGGGMGLSLLLPGRTCQP